MANSAVGVIFSNVHDENIPELSRHRTMASIPYGGRYRLIDFSLSNMVNAGITTVGVVTKYNYQSLLDHLGALGLRRTRFDPRRLPALGVILAGLVIVAFAG